MESAGKWHDDVFFGIHYDLHAGENDTELGAELTEEHLEERLRLIDPDWIQCDCKGHPGWTSWPTDVGSTSPGVVKDALRIHRDVTKKLGIKLGMHYSGVFDRRAIELHPEWGRINADGSRDEKNTCRMSGYTEELMISQMLELIDKYDIDGFWVDGENWASAPCYCEKCREEFRRRTGLEHIPEESDEENWDEWLAFHRRLFVEHVTKYANAVHERKPECCVCSNWMYTIRQPDPVEAPVDYLSGDFDWIWGADRAAVEGRLLDGRDLSWDLMAWDFIKTRGMKSQQPWTVKPALHLKQEISEVLALGGAVMCYEKPQRSGWLVGWRHEMLADVARFARERKEPLFQSETVPQAAVLHLADHYYRHNAPLFNYGEAVQPVEGALHSLLETHRSTDILTEERAIDTGGEYQLLVVPEQTHLSDAIVQKLESFVAAGGCVLMSGSHLSHDYPELVGARPSTEEPERKTAGRGIQCCLPVDDEAVAVFGDWQPVVPKSGTESLANRMVGEEPGKDTTDEVVVTKRGGGDGEIVAVHGPLFENYYAGHYPKLRRFIASLVDRMKIDWVVEIDAPPQLEAVLRRKDGNLIVNLINRGAGEMLMPRRVLVENLPPIEDVVVRIRTDAKPESVAAMPEDQEIEWSYANGWTTVRVPQIHIHMALVVQ
ncbi:MAG: alpha-L-fucosidase [Candidatus Brocadiia bacterium]